MRGLTAADFTVLEDSEAQRIVSFEELDAPEPDGSLVPWMREVAPDVRTNTADHRRIVLIVLNDAGLNFRFNRDVKDIGRKLVDQLGPADQAAIVFTGNNGRSQDFTNDRRVLRAAVDRYVDTSMPPELSAAYGIGIVKKAVQALLDIPHRRKALIFVGGGLGFTGTGAGAGGIGMMGGGAEALASTRDRSYDLVDTIKHAQRANVTVFTISPMGLEAPAVERPDLSIETLQAASNATGGFAVVNTNSFDAQIRQIFRETGSYYLLGFQSAHRDGKFRRLQVKVNRPDVTVRTRSGYEARKPEKESRPEKPGDPPLALAKAVTGILPNPDMPMRVSVAPFATRGKDTATVTIVLGPQQPARRERVVEKIDVMSRAFDTNGSPRGWFRQVAQLTLRPSGGSGDAKYEVLSKLELKPGRYNLRFAVHSASLGKSGSVYHDVEISDFSNAALSLSGVVLGVQPALLVAPRDFLSTLVPVSPTTQRSFATTDKAAAFVRVYQGGKRPPIPAILTTTIIDDGDQQVHSANEALPPDQFGEARSVDHRFELPLDRLKPGAHLLRFTLSGGAHTVAREVRFVVR